jgi:hypothetical protein
MHTSEPEILVVLADLGTVRVFRTRATELGHAHLLELDPPEQPPAPEPLHAQVSDQAGRFPGGGHTGEPGGMLRGEEHEKTAEGERRQIDAVAAIVEQVVSSEDCDTWRLAAPKSINNRLVAQLSLEIRERLVLNLHVDLVKLPLREVEQRLLRKSTTAGT